MKRLILLSFILCAPLAAQTPTPVGTPTQAHDNQYVVVNTVSVSHTSTGGSGHSLYVACLAYHGGGWVGTDTGTASDGVNTFTVASKSNASTVFVQLNRATNITGGTRNVTCTFGQNTVASTIYVAEFSNTANTNDIDIADESNAYGTNGDVITSLTTTNATDLFITAGVMDGGAATITDYTGSTVLISTGDGANLGGGFAYRTTTTTGAYSVGFTSSPAPNIWAAAGAAFKSSAGSTRRRQVVIE